MFRTEQELDRADFDLLRDGPITLYWGAEVFEQAQRDLRALGYRIAVISAASRQTLVADLSEALKWRSLFGYEPWSGNLDALDDAFYQPDFPAGECVALCFDGFHRLMLYDAPFALALLDVAARGSRTQLLHGRRVIILVRTDDAAFHTPELGGASARWNSRECLNSDRGL